MQKTNPLESHTHRVVFFMPARMINSKTALRAYDYLFTAGRLGAIGYFNNWMTKKRLAEAGLQRNLIWLINQ